MSEDDDYDDYQGPEESPLLGEMGCLFHSECCMPGMHYTSECFTAEDAEAWHKESSEGI